MMVLTVAALVVGVGVGAVLLPLLLDAFRQRAMRRRWRTGQLGRVWRDEDDDELARWREGKI